ncbi:uncharacterized protein LOC133925815 [Phragmites australis]|uniref:uncharacterized protein LOC133925815 n=1 Tax=Phragmites australis TaxID=29695 RepID=UPI002D787A9B|nr:uncharacterized protein LOC133925815 [Phragmites australis]
MVTRTLEIACLALLMSTIAVQVPSFLDQSATTATSAQASPLDGAVLQVLLPLAVMEALFTAVAFHLPPRAPRRRRGVGNRGLSELVAFILCLAVCLLEFFLFVQPSGGVDGGAQARALGLAAVRALPASATVTFFLGMALIYLHVGTGGGRAGGNGPVPEPAVRLLTETTLEAAAALIGMMAMAVYTI